MSQSPDRPSNPEESPTPATGDKLPTLAAAGSVTAESKANPELSPEEQLALYEKELRENDWGHQPC